MCDTSCPMCVSALSDTGRVAQHTSTGYGGDRSTSRTDTPPLGTAMCALDNSTTYAG